MKFPAVLHILIFCSAWSSTTLAAKYEIRDLQLKPAVEYPAHQDFQGLAIGAHPCLTLAQLLEIFDTEKLHNRGLLPVLLVIENRNQFPDRIRETEIFLVKEGERRQAPIPFERVLYEIEMKQPASNVPSKKDLDIKKKISKEMYLDFETKSFGEKTIPPSGQGSGVVFFRMEDKQSLEGLHLYFPEIRNVDTDQALMFFEFELFPEPF